MDRILLRYPPEAQDSQSPLVAAAWAFRLADHLTNQQQLAAMNVAAWLYTNNASSKDEIYVRRNITKNEIVAEFGPAPTKPAEVGFHAEAVAGDFFRKGINRMKVRAIFSERVPCSNPTGGNWRAGCRQLLQHYFSEFPVYYMYNSYDTTEDGNAPVGKALSLGYSKRQPHTFPGVQVVPELLGGGRLQSLYRIYSL